MTDLPTPSAPSAPSLDHLYWETDLPVEDVAAAVGVPAAGIHRRVAPLDAGLPCYRCGGPVTYTSRSARASARPRCARCGCSRHDPARARPDRPPSLRLVPSTMGGVVVVHDDGRDLGHAIESCAAALAGAGISWTGELVRVTDPALTAPAVVRALGACTPAGVVAVPSLAALGTSQAERLQVLFTLTRMGWRVVSAWDVHVASPYRPLTAADLEADAGWDVDDEYLGVDVGPEAGLADALLTATSSPSGGRRRAVGW